jgi:hypothetical protein
MVCVGCIFVVAAAAASSSSDVVSFGFSRQAKGKGKERAMRT